MPSSPRPTSGGPDAEPEHSGKATPAVSTVNMTSGIRSAPPTGKLSSMVSNAQWAAREAALAQMHAEQLGKLQNRRRKQEKKIAKLQKRARSSLRAQKAMGRVVAECEDWLKHE